MFAEVNAMSLGTSDFGRLEWATRAGRIAIEIPVDLHGTEGPIPGVTRNISLDGAFVATNQLMPIGARLLMMMVFPDETRPLAVRAEVRWSRLAASALDDGRPVGMGVRFLDPPLGVSLSISELLESERTGQF